MKRTPWDPRDVDLVLSMYPEVPTEKLALLVDRSTRSVYQLALKHGVKKSAHYMRTHQAGRLDGIRGGATRFQKGKVPWNKGMKGLQIGGEKTQFGPGHMPHNTLPIGTYRLDKDGTLQRKISNDKGNNSKRWRGVHELVWVAANGPVPPKHIIVFKPGMRTKELEEITLDKVECISLAENMRRNTVHNLPPELAKTVQLIGALNRKINRGKHNQ
jgi:hypothetical protein